MSAQPNNPPSTDASEHTIPATAVASTSRCYLRPYEPSDAPALAEAANDLEIVRYMRSRFPSPYTLANAESWITFCSAPGEPSLTQAIFTPQGEFAGALTLEAAKGDSIYAGTRELGYFAARKLWGRGIMTDAVREFTKWAFATVPELLRIEAAVFEGNQGSQRVLSKAGFVKEGTRRLAAVKKGEPINEVQFGLIRADIEP